MASGSDLITQLPGKEVGRELERAAKKVNRGRELLPVIVESG
jgi:hypothetical protein